MQLDNIIYDVGTLQNALVEQWSADSPAFQALFPSDTGTALLNVFAAYGSMLQYTMVSALANVYTPTAFSEAAIYQLAETLGNSLHGNVSSQVQVKITKHNFIGIATIIPAETQFIIQNKNFFNPSAIMLPANVSTMDDIVLIQGEMMEVNKATSGIANEKIYFASDWKCNYNYVKVYVNGEQWDVADSFLEFDKNYVLDQEAMKTVILRTDSDGRSYIKFGDNQLAKLPTSGSSVRIKYVSNEGADGNIQEKDIEGSVASSLIFSDNYGNQDVLNIDITTTTTAYGGFGKQSIDVLRQTSPYIFASGHRAIRRQDYNALLQNKCGYITSSVWGEYEEADHVGAYDALMMNMVYYTGIKSFQNYPYFNLNQLMDPYILDSGLYSERGFYGSFSLRVQNLKNTTANVLIQDTGAKGYLFINDNKQDPRDSILVDWKHSMGTLYYASLTDIISGGTGYEIGDILYLDDTNKEVFISVNNVDLSGAVTSAKLTKYACTQDYTEDHSEFTTTYSYKAGAGLGSGLKVAIRTIEMKGSTLVNTNDYMDADVPNKPENPIENARSDTDEALFYQSEKQPTLLKPTQIIFTFTEGAKTIAGVKFRAADPDEGPFPTTMCIFGTNIEPMPSLYNIRNSKDWVKLTERENLVNPYNNINDDWTEWYPTNTFLGTRDDEDNPEFDSYKYYVIEFYSTEDTSNEVKCTTIGKMKVLYGEDASVMYYNDNSTFRLLFPKESDIGPSESKVLGYYTKGTDTGTVFNVDTITGNQYTVYTLTSDNKVYEGSDTSVDPIGVWVQDDTTYVKHLYIEDNNEVLETLGYIDETYGTLVVGPNTYEYIGIMSLENPNILNKRLLNTDTFPMYYYTATLSGITRENNYRDGNVLAYVFRNENTEIPFFVDVENVDNGIYGIRIGDNNFDLTGTENIRTTTPVSLDETLVYKVSHFNSTGNIDTTEGESEGSGYLTNDIVELVDSNNNPLGIRFRITSAVNGNVKRVVILNEYNKVLGIQLTDTYNTVLVSSPNGKGALDGTGLILKVISTPLSGYESNGEWHYGSGANISIAPNYNLQLSASFVGNRIDSQNINKADQPIMEKYNHFTTFMEYKQPEIIQVGIIIKAELDTTAAVTSGIIIQNIKNNVLKLFEVTSDYIGKGLKLSDIYTAVMSTEYVKWCKVITPNDNIDIPQNGLMISSYIDVIETVAEY